MEINDATDEPIAVGTLYGYSNCNNGINIIVIGRCVKSENFKVTLGEITEKTYHGMRHTCTEKSTRLRTVMACRVFPVKEDSDAN